MPQVKTRSSTATKKRATDQERPSTRRIKPGNVHELIGKMLDYEAAALQQGVSFASGRFKMLTTSEQQSLRAELVADYIRLSCGNTGRTPGYYDATLTNFCAKICDAELPSHELIGTYLAAMDIVNEKDIAWLKDAVRITMIEVLQSCVDLMHEKTKHARTQTIAA